MMINCETRGIVALFRMLGLHKDKSNLVHVRFMLLGEFQIFIALGFVEAACLTRGEIEDQMERAQRVG